MYVYYNTETRSRNHCCCGKSLNVTQFSVCVCVHVFSWVRECVDFFTQFLKAWGWPARAETCSGINKLSPVDCVLNYLRSVSASSVFRVFVLVNVLQWCTPTWPEARFLVWSRSKSCSRCCIENKNTCFQYCTWLLHSRAFDIYVTGACSRAQSTNRSFAWAVCNTIHIMYGKEAARRGKCQADTVQTAKYRAGFVQKRQDLR